MQSKSKWIPAALFSACSALMIGPAAHADKKKDDQPKGPSQEEIQRVLHAAEWRDVIEAQRAKQGQRAVPTIKFPSQDEAFLASLKYAEDQKGELRKYLDKLWAQNKTPAARQTALATLWDEAEKPAFVRGAVEDYYKGHAGGQPLHAPAEPPALEGAGAPGSAAPVANVTPPPAATTGTPPANATGKP